MAGNLGQNKTVEGILQSFFRPMAFKDMSQLCKTSVVCQKSAVGRKSRVPLIPLTVIGEPFERIAMDIVGLLSRS